MPTTSAAPFQAHSQPLTVDNLKSLEDNGFPSVLGFVREQRENTRYYAQQAAMIEQQGTGNLSKHDISVPKSPSAAKMQASSPPLVARVDIRKRNLEAAVNDERTRNQNQTKNLEGCTQEQIIYGETSRKSKDKKRGPARSDEDEYSARLLERRERKRAKRNIVNPKQKEPMENMSPEASPKRSDIDRPSKKKGKRGKTSPGVALMETFTAANLKSSRLTLKPKNGGGLFKQAKSSVSVAISGKENKGSTKDDVLSKDYSKQKLAAVRKVKDKASRNKHVTSQKRKRTSSSSFSRAASGISDTASDKPKCSGDRAMSVHSVSDHHVEETKGASANDAYSDSWGIGSQLPSDTSSVGFSAVKKGGVKAIAGQDPSAPSVVMSEPAIRTMSTQWRFDGSQEAFGTFRSVIPREPTMIDGLVHLMESDKEIAAPTSALTHSRYFLAPVLSFSTADLTNTPKEPSNLQMSDVADMQVQGIDDYDAEGDLESYIRDEDIVPIFREASPTNSLDCMLAAHDEEEATYWTAPDNHLDEYPTVWEYNQSTEEPPEDASNLTEDYVSGELMPDDEPNMVPCYGDPEGISDTIYEDLEYDYADRSGGLYNEDLADPDSEINPLGGLSAEQDLVDENELDAVYYEGQESWDEEERELTLSTSDEQADVLPLAGGRLLLMGMENPPMGPFSTRGVTRGSGVTYGQSVQEIEIAFGSQVGRRW